MFYDNPLLRREVPPGTKLESALVALTPAESKRLVARGVCALPELRAALKKGTVVIAWGTTNALVAEELLGTTIAHKSDFASGVICDGELKANSTETKVMPFVLKDGQPSEIHQKAALATFLPGDVFIKGANAVDAKGEIGILTAAHYGGLAQEAWFAVVGRGGLFICPVGLEKLVPSVSEAVLKCGLFRYKYSLGLPTALVTFPTARAFTEIQAIQALSGATATHVASGGIGGSEGSVALVLEGEAAVLEKAFEVVKSVKGEPQLPPPRQYSIPPAASMGYDARTIFETHDRLVQEFMAKTPQQP